ncbi:Predicted ATPase [Allokutzneria albata]|uniref:Predicted ATPase n=1 Tax=Allokutzneria albata TaxID=211114 RepID=A0A1G9Y661_ALLAB|nr:Predicted ATPase [Allokutzneria albata]
MRLLANGLQLVGPQRKAFEAAAYETAPDPTARDGIPGAGWTSPPAFSGPFIGREAEAAILTELLTTDAEQVISVVGVAGVGKTRLVSEVSKVILRQSDWRVVWLSSHETIASHMDTYELYAPSKLLSLGSGEDSRSGDMSKVLVVLDGASGGSARFLTELLRQVPRPHVLITARAPLGLPRELVFPVGPLAVPTLDKELKDLTANPSVRLLLWHLRRVSPWFQLRDDNAVAVARLCWLLDGLPRALELGAAMCTMRSPQRLVDQLIDQPHAIRDWRSSVGSGELLLSSLEESLSLLRGAEQALLEPLASSGGVWSLDEAAAAAELACADAIEHMELLVRCGLVRHNRAVGEPRFSLLNLVRTAHCGARSGHTPARR